MTITLGFSPCPNDTFIFDALVNQKIDTHGLSFKVVLDDVQSLNQMAIEGQLDVSKISYGVLPLVLAHYNLLHSGGALGKGVGPLLIAREPVANLPHAIQSMHVAIPGVHTTAHMLFSLAYPLAGKKTYMVFNQVEDAVLKGEVDAGVIIHENRFTYQQKGLHSLVDLGEYWEHHTGVPIPLGGIVVRKTFDDRLQQAIDKLIYESLQYSFAHYPNLPDYTRMHAQEMDETVMRQHIDLYVNNFSLQLGADGQLAVQTLLNVYCKQATQPSINLAQHLAPLPF